MWKVLSTSVSSFPCFFCQSPKSHSIKTNNCQPSWHFRSFFSALTFCPLFDYQPPYRSAFSRLENVSVWLHVCKSNFNYDIKSSTMPTWFIIVLWLLWTHCWIKKRICLQPIQFFLSISSPHYPNYTVPRLQIHRTWHINCQPRALCRNHFCTIAVQWPRSASSWLSSVAALGLPYSMTSTQLLGFPTPSPRNPRSKARQ